MGAGACADGGTSAIVSSPTSIDAVGALAKGEGATGGAVPALPAGRSDCGRPNIVRIGAGALGAAGGGGAGAVGGGTTGDVGGSTLPQLPQKRAFIGNGLPH